MIVLNESANINDCVDLAADILNKDGTILTPTDTVYGLVCLPSSLKAIEAIYEMKQRPLTARLPIIVADKQQAKQELPLIWNEAADALAEHYWPGALTLAFGIRTNDLDWLEGREEAGVRAPDHLFIQMLARKVGPFLMTSANRHGVDTPHTAEGALLSLTKAPSLVIDGGTLSGAPSTLVNVNLPQPVIERHGSIPDALINQVLYENK